MITYPPSGTSVFPASASRTYGAGPPNWAGGWLRTSVDDDTADARTQCPLFPQETQRRVDMVELV
ncbi:hypothetical protein PG990_006596 [Apiospora arundinis]|uniref:Uncharacterized protein n=1 Tax=Apiospora arundinis TaxID=335852 RepID=A0ABR2JAL1_9PEZI